LAEGKKREFFSVKGEFSSRVSRIQEIRKGKKRREQKKKKGEERDIWN